MARPSARKRASSRDRSLTIAHKIETSTQCGDLDQARSRNGQARSLPHRHRVRSPWLQETGEITVAVMPSPTRRVGAHEVQGAATKAM